MTQLFRTRVALTGFPGGPGVSTMHFLSLPTAREALHDLWTALALVLPTDVHIEVEPFGDIIEDTSGALVGTFTGFAQSPMQGSSVDAYAAPVGLLARWSTDTIVAGHRLRGRTFIVPVGQGMFNTAGQVNPVMVGGVQTPLTNFQLAVAGKLVVWHRPKFGPAPVGGGQRPLLAPGSHGVVTGSGLSTKAVVLRSRRD